MLRKVGGCTTTAFAMYRGLDMDPSISLRVELVNCWLDVAASTTKPPAAIRKSWVQLLRQLAFPRGRWHKVKGPMAAGMATLVDLH